MQVAFRIWVRFIFCWLSKQVDGRSVVYVLDSSIFLGLPFGLSLVSWICFWISLYKALERDSAVWGSLWWVW